MREVWSFKIDHYPGYPNCAASAIGVRLATPEEVEAIGARFSIPVHGRDEAWACRQISVEMETCDPRLSELLKLLKDQYGFEPSPQFVVPRASREHHFGLRRRRVYTTGEIDACDYLL